MRQLIGRDGRSFILESHHRKILHMLTIFCIFRNVKRYLDGGVRVTVGQGIAQEVVKDPLQLIDIAVELYVLHQLCIPGMSGLLQQWC